MMRRPLEINEFVGQSTLWNSVQRLHYIDNALETENFHKYIVNRTPNGFRVYFYSSSDNSEHHNNNRHVLIISANSSDDIYNTQPSFCHVTSSVSNVKSENATKNADSIIDMLGLYIATFYGGGTNDNAADAQLEIYSTFDHILGRLMESHTIDEAMQLEILFENGMKRRPIVFGDPFHIANLCVTWASVFAFGDTEKADHTQVHHRQLLQSIHSLHSSDPSYSQKVMDQIMSGSGRSCRVTS